MDSPAAVAEWRAAMGDRVDEWRWDPLLFAEEIIPWGKGRGGDTPYGPWVRMHGWMRDVLEEFGEVLRKRREADPERIGHIGILVSSGHGSGKSTALIPVLTAWGLVTRLNSRGVMTAPSEEQLKTRAWGFTRALFESSPLLRKWFQSKDTYISTNKAGAVREGMHPTHGIIPSCPAPERNERLLGFHADSLVMALLEEAEGVADRNYDALSGMLYDPFSLHVAVGNPVRTTGWFRDAVGADGHASVGRYAQRWTIRRCIDIRSIPGMDTPQLAAEIKASGGEDSDFTRPRVRGIPPRTSSDQFIPRQLCEAAQERTREWLGDHGRLDGKPDVVGERERLGAGAPHPGEGYPVQCAVDLARGGSNYTVALFRRGYDAGTFPILREQGRRHTAMSLAMWLREIMETAYGLDDPQKPALMRLDESGTAGFASQLLHQWGHKQVIGVNMGALSPTGDMLNYRSYCWARAKEFLEGGAMLPLGELGDRLVDELCLPTAKADGRNLKLKIEAKEDLIVKNRGESPDLADAFTMLALPSEGHIERQYRHRFERSGRGAALRPHQRKYLHSSISPGAGWRAGA